ncbi:hypothetical protein CVT26_006812 [Gymnopilus dilepis]|uniref:Uncharacterized protein n=1 Tax=Gymnopilus dilepis TaxID=231916 RepID=A0A409Y326_9AGAR|nr:hypothetical protein CVT26_006812 [Gymnopilus dilepis]
MPFSSAASLPNVTAETASSNSSAPGTTSSEPTTTDAPAATSTTLKQCTVKRCKRLVEPPPPPAPVSSETSTKKDKEKNFKMCVECRDRYRLHGITKRARQRLEREREKESFDVLRVVDGRRKYGIDMVQLSRNACHRRSVSVWPISVVIITTVTVKAITLSFWDGDATDAGPASLNPDFSPPSPSEAFEDPAGYPVPGLTNWYTPPVVATPNTNGIGIMDPYSFAQTQMQLLAMDMNSAPANALGAAPARPYAYPAPMQMSSSSSSQLANALGVPEPRVSAPSTSSTPAPAPASTPSVATSPPAAAQDSTSSPASAAAPSSP